MGVNSYEKVNGGDLMVEKKESWIKSQVKGLNIWVIILIAMWAWNVFLRPAIAKEFATQTDIVNVTNNFTAQIESTEHKIEAIKSEFKEAIASLEHKIDKSSGKMDDIYKFLINMKRR